MTTIAIIRETKTGENRVAASADAVKKYVALGTKVMVERGAGAASSIADNDYEVAGATLVAGAKEALAGADIVLKVSPPTREEIAMIPEGAMLRMPPKTPQ